MYVHLPALVVGPDVGHTCVQVEPENDLPEIQNEDTQTASGAMEVDVEGNFMTIHFRLPKYLPLLLMSCSLKCHCVIPN
jgi:hypothetical protein